MPTNPEPAGTFLEQFAGAERAATDGAAAPGSARSFRVHVLEQVSEPLAGAPPSEYLSPPQPEQQARQLIRMLAGPAALNGPGPWRQPIAGGRRLIRLTPDGIAQ